MRSLSGTAVHQPSWEIAGNVCGVRRWILRVPQGSCSIRRPCRRTGGNPLTPPLIFGSGEANGRDVGWMVVSSIGERYGRLPERDRESERIGECLGRAGKGRGG